MLTDPHAPAARVSEAPTRSSMQFRSLRSPPVRSPRIYRPHVRTGVADLQGMKRSRVEGTLPVHFTRALKNYREYRPLMVAAKRSSAATAPPFPRTQGTVGRRTVRRAAAAAPDHCRSPSAAGGRRRSAPAPRPSYHLEVAKLPGTPSRCLDSIIRNPSTPAVGVPPSREDYDWVRLSIRRHWRSTSPTAMPCRQASPRGQSDTVVR